MTEISSKKEGRAQLLGRDPLQSTYKLFYESFDSINNIEALTGF